MLLGIHCPVAGGFAAALERALALRCEAMQMLPYRRHHEDSAQEEARGFPARRRRGGVKALLLHSRFVPSLASSQPERRGRSIALLREELALVRTWEADGYVLHAGAFSPEGSSAGGLRLAAEAVAQAAGEAGLAAPLLLENVPGGGRRLGGTLEELAELIGAVSRSYAAAYACLDTAHAWAAGYDVSSAAGMTAFLARAKALLGADRIRAFHLNDTGAAFGSHREDHAVWGQGRLSADGVKELLGDPAFGAAVGILEPPRGGGEARGLAFLRAL